MNAVAAFAASNPDVRVFVGTLVESVVKVITVYPEASL